MVPLCGAPRRAPRGPSYGTPRLATYGHAYGAACGTPYVPPYWQTGRFKIGQRNKTGSRIFTYMHIVYMYMHAYMYTCICICISTSMHFLYIYIYIYIYICRYILVCVYVYVHTCVEQGTFLSLGSCLGEGKWRLSWTSLHPCCMQLINAYTHELMHICMN